jgi:phosphatidylinositol glycan class Q protein
VYCCGYRYHSVSSEVLLYKQPQIASLQYLSLEPLTLDISVQPEPTGTLGSKSGDSKTKPDDAIPKNSKKVYQHSRFGSRGRGSANNEMETILHQINASNHLEDAIKARCAKCHIHPPIQQSSVNAKVKGSAYACGVYVVNILRSPARLLFQFAKPIVVHPIMLVLFTIRVLAEVMLYLLNVKPPAWMFGGLGLKDVSVTGVYKETCPHSGTSTALIFCFFLGQQIDLRLQQACFWPWQWMQFRKKDWRNTANTRAQYIR